MVPGYLRYLLIAVTSAPNCTSKPEALPRPHFFPFPPRPSFPSFSSHVDLDFVSLCCILHPTDRSYESYLVAFSGSYEIAEASVVDASEY